MTTSHPIFGLLRRIEDDTVRREALTLVNYLGVQTVEGLAQYSKPALIQNDVTPETVGVLEQLLQTEYQIQFNIIPPKPVPAPRELHSQINAADIFQPIRRLQQPYHPRSLSSSRAGGAPPPGILESVPTHPDLATYLNK